MFLQVEGVRFRYDSRPVLEDVSFAVQRGELCSVLGNNGAGKSTLLKCLARILRARAGTVHLAHEDIASLTGQELAKRLSYVAQRGNEPARLTVFDAVLQGRKPHISWSIRQQDLVVVEEVLASLHMSELSFRYLDQLSGGELQKVVIARALAQEPEVLLLDEPTSNLDLRNQLDVMGLVRRMTKEKGMAVLVAIHDINLALRFSDTFLLMHEGSVLACGGAEALTPTTIHTTYGVSVRLLKDGDQTLIVPNQPPDDAAPRAKNATDPTPQERLHGP